jgi:hypothetical protein
VLFNTLLNFEQDAVKTAANNTTDSKRRFIKRAKIGFLAGRTPKLIWLGVNKKLKHGKKLNPPVEGSAI